MNKTLKKLLKKGKKVKPMGNPKIVTVNKPKNPLMKWLIVLALVLLLGFSIFYIMKITSPSFARMYAERFTDDAQPTYEVVLIKRPDCPACIAFDPTYTAVKESMPGVKFTEKIASDESVAQYGITVVPTIVVLDKSGKAIAGARREGGMSEDDFRGFVASFTQASVESERV